MSYEWSESDQAFVLRVPAVPVSALRALLKKFEGYRDAPIGQHGNRIEVTTIRKTLNVVVAELAALCDQVEKP